MIWPKKKLPTQVSIIIIITQQLKLLSPLPLECCFKFIRYISQMKSIPWLIIEKFLPDSNIWHTWCRNWNVSRFRDVHCFDSSTNWARIQLNQPWPWHTRTRKCSLYVPKRPASRSFTTGAYARVIVCAPWQYTFYVYIRAQNVPQNRKHFSDAFRMIFPFFERMFVFSSICFSSKMKNKLFYYYYRDF